MRLRLISRALQIESRSGGLYRSHHQVVMGGWRVSFPFPGLTALPRLRPCPTDLQHEQAKQGKSRRPTAAGSARSLALRWMQMMSHEYDKRHAKTG